ncbi:MAG: AsnC family transcriptional regulator [Candidatus Thorarchaeota archaeon]|nr:AsnC family transcriptional regulator [Candidatus Thorarchaeota archaeon]
MDSIDKGIILALDRNCRKPYQAMSMDLGISPNAVRKRLNNLVRVA